MIPEGINIPSRLLSEKTMFATILHKDSFESLEESYVKLMNFIEENSYEIIGDSIELSNELMLPLDKGIGGIIKKIIPFYQVDTTVLSLLLLQDWEHLHL